jgi:hypothetical protein
MKYREEKERLNFRDGQGRSLFHAAAAAAASTLFEPLTEHGALVDAKDPLNRTAQHAACRHGNTWAVTVLLAFEQYLELPFPRIFKAPSTHSTSRLCRETLRPYQLSTT